MNNTKIILSEYMKTLSVYNTHSHHLPHDDFSEMNLAKLISHSYLGEEFSCAASGDESIKSFCDRMQNRSFFFWLSQALENIYKIPEPLSATNCGITSEAISAAYNDHEHHINILEKECRYSHVIIDAYWNPGEPRGDSSIFESTYRVNMYFYGYSLEAFDHNGNNPYRNNNWQMPQNLDEYVSLMEAELTCRANSGCVAFKCASAYDRGLDFAETSKADAEKVFSLQNPSQKNIYDFQNYIFYQICRIAANLHRPLQIHTGLGKMQKSNCTYLTEAIRLNPNTKFVLFHGSYPWLDDLCGLAYTFPNVIIDLCWLPIISTSAAKRFLSELLEICGANRITWGCDTWVSEDSLGALMAIREVLSDVLSEKISNQFLTLTDAKELCSKILFKNANSIYHP